MNICIIPARIGSKRIKEKNIVKIFGKPLISHVIDEIKKSNIFDEIIVSTDSKKIIKISEKSGAKIYFKRPKKLCKDNTTTLEIVRHALNFLINKDFKIDNVCCIYPTAILLKSFHIKKSYKSFKNYKAGFLFSAAKFEHPIERALIRKGNKILMVNKKYENKESNKIKDHFYDLGQFYWGKTIDWVNKKSILDKNSQIYLLSRNEAIDINYKDDLQLAKALFSKK